MGIATTAFHYADRTDPEIAGVSPGEGRRTGGQLVTIAGAHFTPGTEIRFGVDPDTGLGGSPATEITLLDDDLLHHQVDLGRSTTYERFAYATAGLRGHRGDVAVDDVQRVLGDHEGYPRSVCSHLYSVEPDVSKTCGALVCDLASAHMWATRGCAHDAEFTEIRVRS